MTEEGEPPRASGAAVLERARDTAWVTVGDEVVIFRVEPPVSFVLDRVAGLLWQCLDGTSPLQDIVDDLADAFNADRIAVSDDCLSMVALWLERDIVEEVNRG